MNNLENRKYVLLTGATSGIGYELSKLYAKDGFNLILVARDIVNLKKVSKELEMYNVQVEVLSVDLSKENSCEQILNFVDKKNLIVNILINNAGVGSFGYINDLEIDKELNLIDINIKALVKLTKMFLPAMVRRKEGAIMNVASTAAFCAGPKMANYYASKAYVLNFTEALYEEVKANGIRVSCLCPGAVDTSFQKKAGIKKSSGADKNLMEAKEVATIAYREFNKGKVIIIPGFKNKAIIVVNKFLPRAISRKIILKMNKG